MRRLEPIVLVAEMTRADDATLVVLDLQHREAGEVHRIARVIEQVCAVAALQRRNPKPVVRRHGACQRGGAQTHARALVSHVSRVRFAGAAHDLFPTEAA